MTSEGRQRVRNVHYAPNLNLIERLWKFVKKQCLYSKYYTDFSAFTSAIEDCFGAAPTDTQQSPEFLTTTHLPVFQKSSVSDHMRYTYPTLVILVARDTLKAHTASGRVTRLTRGDPW